VVVFYLPVAQLETRDVNRLDHQVTGARHGIGDQRGAVMLATMAASQALPMYAQTWEPGV
jgi:hypothetical protein